jgi:hypothetical protein
MPRNLRYLAAGAAAGALALGSVGSAAALVSPGPLVGDLAGTVGGVLGTVVPAATAPIVGQGGLLDDTTIVANANVNVPNVAQVNTANTVTIDDGVVVADTDTHANVANVVRADVVATATVDTNRPSITVVAPVVHADVAGIRVNAVVAPTTVDLGDMTVDAPFIGAPVVAGDIKAKVKAKVHADLVAGKIKAKVKAKAKIGSTKIKLKAKAKVKLRPHLTAWAKVRAIVR